MTSKHRQIRANSLRAVSLLVSLSIYYSDRLLVFWIANDSPAFEYNHADLNVNVAFAITLDFEIIRSSNSLLDTSQVFE